VHGDGHDRRQELHGGQPTPTDRATSRR
jgi:hypothetical protein